MKKRLFAALSAACVCLACLPVLSGCKGGTDYKLKTDENGVKYYSVKCSGFKNSVKGEYVIPEEYGEGEDRAPVREIESEGFAGTSLTKITIPKTIEKIGNAAFAYNNSLAEVVFEEGIELEEISRGTFGYCYSLRSLKIPEGVKSLGYMSFYNCAALIGVDMPSSLERIGGFAFQYCTALTEVGLPDGLEQIGEGAFSGCEGLTEIVIPGGLEDRTEPVLDGNGEQKKDEDGNALIATVYGLGQGAFHSCTSLTLAVIGEGIKTISSGAFGYCTSLKTLYLPASLEKVEGSSYKDGAFYTGHAFHSVGALTDIFYAGTADMWEELEKKIVKEPAYESGYEYNNGALFSAPKHFEVSYKK